MPTRKQCRRLEAVIAHDKPVFLGVQGQAHYADVAGRVVDAMSVLDKPKGEILAAYLGIHGHPADLSLECIGQSLLKPPATRQAAFQQVQSAGKKLRASFDLHGIIRTYFIERGQMP